MDTRKLTARRIAQLDDDDEARRLLRGNIYRSPPHAHEMIVWVAVQ